MATAVWGCNNMMYRDHTNDLHEACSYGFGVESGWYSLLCKHTGYGLLWGYCSKATSVFRLRYLQVFGHNFSWE